VAIDLGKAELEHENERLRESLASMISRHASLVESLGLCCMPKGDYLAAQTHIAEAISSLKAVDLAVHARWPKIETHWPLTPFDRQRAEENWAPA